MLFSAGRLSRWPSRGHEGRANADASSLYLSHQIPSICSAMRSQKVDCPVCKTERLSMMERQGIEIDYCPKCRGVWLDRGGLDKIIERARDALPPSEPAERAVAHDSHHASRG